jgi:hypothetical protein
MVEKGLRHRLPQDKNRQPPVKSGSGKRASANVLVDGEVSMMSRYSRRSFFRLAALAATAMGVAPLAAGPAAAQESYTAQEVIDSGHRFFGATSGGLATVVEKIFSSYGLPNGYLLGEEASGAFVGGLTYGEGTLYTKNAGDHKVFWQGPSLGFDFGGEGSRIMMLVYNLDDVQSIYERFAGVAGSAYVVAGVGFNVLKRGNVLLVPIRTGLGARLGINLGYLKLTQQATWNPL